MKLIEGVECASIDPPTPEQLQRMIKSGHWVQVFGDRNACPIFKEKENADSVRPQTQNG